MARSILIVLILLLTALFSSAQSPISNEEGLIQSLLSDQPIVGVASGYSINGKIVWKNALGYADKQNDIPFTDTTLTRIASLAKPMTAIAIMQLVESGMIDLDLPIQTYIPDFPQKKKTAITTRMLLSHTSGIKGYKNDKEADNKKHYSSMIDAMNVFADRKLDFEPGSDFLYTSYGYVVLGVLIEQITGMSYEDYMQKNIWNPVGMNNTGIELATEVYQNKSKIYHADKKNVKVIALSDLSNRIPGGGFYSTWTDIMKFGNAVLANKLISEETFNTMIQRSYDQKEGNDYSFGWFLHGAKDDESGVIGHGGQQLGTNSQLFIIPKKKVVALTIANTSGTGNAVIIQAFGLVKNGIELTQSK